jgi:tetratricopeptide (TPR) repeat protein
LHRDTGGNAFFVTEVLASGAVGIPPAVADAVIARVARLTPPARHTLEAAAVIGGRIEPSLVLEVSGVTATALDECVDAGMLRFTPPVFAFRHELARHAIVSALPRQRSRALHAEVLRLLRAGDYGGPEVLARLSDHAEQAGDASAVLELAPAAAELASSLRSHRDAALQYARALRFADSVPPDVRARLLERHAYECYLIGRPTTDALVSCRAALETWRQLGDRLREGDCLRRLSRFAWASGDNSEAEEAARMALEVLTPLPPGRELAWAYSNRSQLRMLSSDLNEAIAWGEKAISLAESLGAEEILVHALNNVGTARVMRGDADGAGTLEESLRRSEQGQYEDHAARAWTNLSSTAVDARNFDAADRYLAGGIAYCEKHDLDN